MVNLITSYDNPTPGSGTVLNQVALTYNTFAQLTKEQQDHATTVSGSTPYVSYAYATGGSSSNQIRPITLGYPDTKIITYDFGTSGGMNDYLNRIQNIQDTTSGTTNLASYSYLGASAVVKIDYPQPQVNLDLWGGTTGTFTGFDQFGRIVNQPWYNYNTSTMLDQYQYGYDQNSNRVWKANPVSAAASVPLDEFYTYDNLNRLTDMQRGTLTGPKTGITGTPTIEQQWTLDATGNWGGYLTKAAGTTDLNQTRTSSTVNAIKTITETTGPTWIVPDYDAAGNMTTMPQTATPTSSYIAIYDAWNRMVQIGDSSYVIAKYQYDGRSRRIVRLGYTSGTLTETRHFYFTNSRRDLEQRVGTATTMDQQHVWSIRYVNELICRDDATPVRLYVCQDANFSISALVNSSAGIIVERFIYTPYGVFVVFDASWSSISDTHNWIYLFQGGQCDTATEFYIFRRRYYGPLLGIWLQRDGEYWDGMNLYEVDGGNTITNIDPTGEYAIDWHRGSNWSAAEKKRLYDLLGAVRARDDELIQQINVYLQILKDEKCNVTYVMGQLWDLRDILQKESDGIGSSTEKIEFVKKDLGSDKVDVSFQHHYYVIGLNNVEFNMTAAKMWDKKTDAELGSGMMHELSRDMTKSCGR